MRFTPLTDEEIQKMSFLPDGTYSYKVIESQEKKSNEGNDYIDLKLEVFNHERKGKVFTNLSFMKLLKHFCDVNNMQDDYNSGSVLDTKCLNKSGGKVIIGFQPEKIDPRAKDGRWKAKNIVVDYINDSQAIESPINNPITSSPDIAKDDIPF